MQLKRLEIRGFKSFADKIDIEFHKGITAIVGPNGSGKSNITDAIRWVLGEQNIRNLRCSKAQEIIFAGSTLKNGLGLAEVSLTLVNEGDLKTDFSEVYLTRRLFRSGESEFYINKTKCRLKDFYDLLADTGLGQDAMSVISQNKIDEILNSKPEERRLFFEETAGVSKYKTKKNVALKKMHDMQENLTRIFDIMSEVSLHLEPLAKEAQKAQKYQNLLEEYKKVKITLVLMTYVAHVKKLQDTENLLKKFYQEEQEKLNLLQEIEDRQTVFSHDLLGIENKLKLQSTKTHEIKDILTKLASKLQFLSEELSQKTNVERELKEEKEKLSATENNLREEKKQLQNETIKIKEKVDLLTNNLTQHKQKAKILAEKIRELKKNYEEVKSRKTQEQQKLLLYNKNLENIEENASKENVEQVGIKEKIKNLKSTLDVLTLDQQKLTLKIDTLKIQKTKAEEKRGFLLEEIEKLSYSLRDLEKDLSLKKQDMHSILTKKNILEELKENYEGFTRAVKAVLLARETFRKDILGAVAEIISVNEKYAIAIDVALGSSKQNIVARDEETAKQAIEYLKRTHQGRATFLPLTSLQSNIMNKYHLEKEKGFLFYANEIVTVNQTLKKVVDFLLGKTIIVDTIQNAIQLAQKYHYKLRLVTLEGDIFYPGGILTGGSHLKREDGYFNRQAEIANLKEKENVCVNDIREIEKKIEDLLADKNCFEHRQRELQAIISDNEKQQVSIKNQIQIMDVKKSLQQKALDELQKKAQQDVQAVISSRQHKNTIENSILRTKDLLKKLDEKCLKLEGQLEVLDNSANALGKEMQQGEIEIARLREVLSQKDTFILLKNKEYSALKTSMAKHELKIKNISQNMENIIIDIKEGEKNKEKLHMNYGEEEKKLAEFNYQKEELLSKNQTNIMLTKEESGKLQALQKEIHKLELSKNNFTNKLQSEVDFLEEKYNINIEEAKKYALDMTKTELTKRVNILAVEIEELGNVNLQAIEEYQKTKTRYDFLKKQSDDLKLAKDNLLQIVKDMDKVIVERFKMEFCKIQEYFREIFVKLFGGGKAELKLTDEADILHAGVEIGVCLPHKKEQNLASLSGGQRVLTVIALLFAFLRCKPAPFSVLDEIDAPLDEANIFQFGKFLGEFSHKTQFIIVTHRKGTMQTADVLYGVTVADKGVSKVISVRLEDSIGGMK